MCLDLGDCLSVTPHQDDANKNDGEISSQSSTKSANVSAGEKSEDMEDDVVAGQEGGESAAPNGSESGGGSAVSCFSKEGSYALRARKERGQLQPTSAEWAGIELLMDSVSQHLIIVFELCNQKQLAFVNADGSETSFDVKWASWILVPAVRPMFMATTLANCVEDVVLPLQRFNKSVLDPVRSLKGVLAGVAATAFETAITQNLDCSDARYGRLLQMHIESVKNIEHYGSVAITHLGKLLEAEVGPLVKDCNHVERELSHVLLEGAAIDGAVASKLMTIQKSNHARAFDKRKKNIECVFDLSKEVMVTKIVPDSSSSDRFDDGFNSVLAAWPQILSCIRVLAIIQACFSVIEDWECAEKRKTVCERASEILKTAQAEVRNGRPRPQAPRKALLDALARVLKTNKDEASRSSQCFCRWGLRCGLALVGYGKAPSIARNLNPLRT